MSNDPFANTTTVKNILNHIISPKIVKDGSGGYTTKTDLVNIDNLIFASRGTGPGSLEAPLTAQCGVVAFSAGQQFIDIFHSRVTANSIIVATNRSVDNDGRRIRYVNPRSNGSFEIGLDGLPGNANNSVAWFIASF